MRPHENVAARARPASARRAPRGRGRSASAVIAARPRPRVGRRAGSGPRRRPPRAGPGCRWPAPATPAAIASSTGSPKPSLREGTSTARAPARSAASRPAGSSPSQSTRPSAPTRAACPRRRAARRADHGPAITRRTPASAAGDRLEGEAGVLVRLDRARVEHVGARRGAAPRAAPAPARPAGPRAPARGRRRPRRTTSPAVSREGTSTRRAAHRPAQEVAIGARLGRPAGAGEVLRRRKRAGIRSWQVTTVRPRGTSDGCTAWNTAAAGEPPRGALAHARAARGRGPGGGATPASAPRADAKPVRHGLSAAHEQARALVGGAGRRGRRACRAPRPRSPGRVARRRGAWRRAGPVRSSGGKPTRHLGRDAPARPVGPGRPPGAGCCTSVLALATLFLSAWIAPVTRHGIGAMGTGTNADLPSATCCRRSTFRQRVRRRRHPAGDLPRARMFDGFGASALLAPFDGRAGGTLDRGHGDDDPGSGPRRERHVHVHGLRVLSSRRSGASRSASGSSPRCSPASTECRPSGTRWWSPSPGSSPTTRPARCTRASRSFSGAGWSAIAIVRKRSVLHTPALGLAAGVVVGGVVFLSVWHEAGDRLGPRRRGLRPAAAGGVGGVRGDPACPAISRERSVTVDPPSIWPSQVVEPFGGTVSFGTGTGTNPRPGRGTLRPRPGARHGRRARAGARAMRL